MSSLRTDRSSPVQDGSSSAPSDVLLSEEAFHDAVEVHGAAVFRYAMSHVGPGHAEDVMSEVFAAAWRSRVKFVDPSDNGLEAWLIGIARNIVASHRRIEKRWLQMCVDALQQRADASSLVDENAIVDRVDAEEYVRSARVAALVATMPARERDPLMLHVVHGRTYTEIAEMLGVPLGTVQSRISRGRSRLVKSIEATGRGRS